MVLYLCTSIFGIALLAIFCKKEKYDMIFAISFIPLFLFFALSYQYGNDHVNYMNSFQRILEEGSESGIEIGFQILVRIFVLLGMPQAWYVFIVAFAALFLGTTTALIKKSLPAEDHWLAFAIFLINPYLCPLMFSSIRQTMSTCIFILAVLYLMEKPIWYLLSCLVAISIHKSAVVLVPVILLFRMRKTTSKMVLVELIIGVIEFIFVNAADVIIQKIKPYLSGQYITYLSSGQHSSLTSTVFVFVLLGLFLYAEYKRSENTEAEDHEVKSLEHRESVYGHLAVLGCYVYIFCMHYAAFARLAMYFEMFFVVAIPQSLRKIEDEWIRTALVVAILGVYVLKLVHFYDTSSFQNFMNYQSWIPLVLGD